MNPDDRRHGQNRGYIAGCRKRCCRRAHASYMRRWRAGLYADEVAVERACSGDRSIRLNFLERRLAITDLNRRGYSDNEIAARLGIPARSVLRARQALGLSAAPSVFTSRRSA